jgi:hypothetical protein
MPTALPPELAILQLRHVPIQPHASAAPDLLSRRRGYHVRRQEREPPERFRPRVGRAEPDAFGVGERAEGEGEGGGGGAGVVGGGHGGGGKVAVGRVCFGFYFGFFGGGVLVGNVWIQRFWVLICCFLLVLTLKGGRGLECSRALG